MRWSRAMGTIGMSLVLAGALAGCTYHRHGDVPVHYIDFATTPPKGNRITHCHAYGCKQQTPFTFREHDIAAIRDLMEATRKADTSHEERRAVAYAVAWMEKRVGDVTGTSADRPGDDFEGMGDPTQMDCVDTATNSTNYLLVLQHNKLLRHHRVGTPFSKEDLTRGLAGWPHWTAVLVETAPQAHATEAGSVSSERPAAQKVKKAAKGGKGGTASLVPSEPAPVAKVGQRWAVDGWMFASGENPAIIEAEKWYIEEKDSHRIAMR